MKWTKILQQFIPEALSRSSKHLTLLCYSYYFLTSDRLSLKAHIDSTQHVKKELGNTHGSLARHLSAREGAPGGGLTDWLA